MLLCYKTGITNTYFIFHSLYRVTQQITIKSACQLHKFVVLSEAYDVWWNKAPRLNARLHYTLLLAVLLLNDGRILSDSMSKRSFRKDTSRSCVAVIVIFCFSSMTGFKVQHLCVKLSYKQGKNNTETKALHLSSNEETMSTTQQIWVVFKALKQNYSC